jgi:hypothetical protein
MNLNKKDLEKAVPLRRGKGTKGTKGTRGTRGTKNPRPNRTMEEWTNKKKYGNNAKHWDR